MKDDMRRGLQVFNFLYLSTNFFTQAGRPVLLVLGHHQNIIVTTVLIGRAILFIAILHPIAPAIATKQEDHYRLDHRDNRQGNSV